MTTCTRCGSDRIIPEADILDRTEGAHQRLTVEIQADPGAFLIKERVHAELKARICCDCGHTELFCGKLEDLWDAWQDALAKGQGE